MSTASQAVTGLFRTFLDQLRAQAKQQGQAAEDALNQQIGDVVRDVVGRFPDVERTIELELIQKVLSPFLAARGTGGGGGSGGGGNP